MKHKFPSNFLQFFVGNKKLLWSSSKCEMSSGTGFKMKSEIFGVDNGIIIIHQEKFLAPKWYYSINKTQTNLYLHKINKTLLNIYKYINKTWLRQKQTKLKKRADLYTIYNTKCRKNTTFR